MAPEPARPRALVVEDNHRVASLLAAVLAVEGHEVDWVTDGLVALAKLRTHTYQLIICDIRLPSLDGVTLYRALAEIRPELLPRLIFMSADVPESAESFLKVAGAPLLEKPFQLEHLRRTVHQVLKVAA